MNLKKLVSMCCTVSLTSTLLVALPASADNTQIEKYPYTVFASKNISISSDGGCINGNVYAGGEFKWDSKNYKNFNGKSVEHTDITTDEFDVASDLILINQKLKDTYFTNCVKYAENKEFKDGNVSFNSAVYVVGSATMDGNASLNRAFGTTESISIKGDCFNANNAVLYTENGDIEINSSNVSFSGLIYAPSGTVTINANNFNLNGIIIADNVVVKASNANMNYNHDIAKLVGVQSEAKSVNPDPKDPEEIDMTDTDEDGLPDFFEKEIGSNPSLADTDGDGIPDGYEAINLGTDPTLTDCDENGTNDADEDSDSDGLSNLKEYELKTNPNNKDTDGDSLTDGDEVNKHKTNPLVVDTDEDGLEDGDEVKFGTNPLVADSDKDGIVDGKEKFKQTFNYDYTKKGIAVTGVSVTMEGTGNLDKTTTIESVMNKDVLCSGVVGLVGEPFEIETSSEFDKATLTFNIDKTKLGEIEFDNLLILWYDEENDVFVEMDTTCNEADSTVSINTTHFSKYMVVDSIEWFKTWREAFDGYMHSYELFGATTVICYDCSGSMSSNDPPFVYSIGNITMFMNYRYLATTSFINSMSATDKTALISFSDSSTVQCKLTNDQSKLNDSLEISSSGRTNADSAIEAAIAELGSVPYSNKHIILLSDGDMSIKKTNLNKLKNKHIILDTIGLGETASNTELKEYAEYTGGEFYAAVTASELERIYCNLQARNKINLDLYADADDDGLPDELEESGMIASNGHMYFSDPTKADTDGDGLLDGEEISCEIGEAVHYNYGTKTDEHTYYSISFTLKSDPKKEDTDGDGINDYNETKGVTYNYPDGIIEKYDGDPLITGLADGVVGRLIMVSSHDGAFWNGHAFLLYESFINDSLDISGFAKGYKYVEDNDGNAKNNWETYKQKQYKISPNRVVSIGNYASDENGLADISGAFGSGSSGGSSSQSGTDAAASGIHLNMELSLLYSSENGDENGSYIRTYGNNAAVSKAVTSKQLSIVLSYCNSITHYNFITNNCAEIAGKAWNEAFETNIDFRIWIGTPSPQALKKSIKRMEDSFTIDFHSEWWNNYTNQKIVDWS